MSLSLMMSIKRIIITAIWVLVWGISGLPAFGQSKDVSETQLIQRAEQAITRLKTLRADFANIVRWQCGRGEIIFSPSHPIAAGI